MVVLRSTEDGSVLDRWEFEEAVVGLQMSDGWLVAWLLSEDYLGVDGSEISALAAVDLETGEVTIVETRTTVFLPA